MATYDFTFYTGTPASYGFPTGTGTFTYTGPSDRTGVGQITDNGSGDDGLYFSDNDGVTGTFTVGGNTSTNVSTEPDGGYILRDTVTGEEFRVNGFDVIGGAAAGTYTMSEKALVPGREYQVLQYEGDPSEGGTGARYAEIVCFAPGTLIDTPTGPKAVETLRIGDPVWTLDAGPCPIRWIRQDHQPLEGLSDDKRPVLIRADALGPGRPMQDLVVSPNHRILVGGHGQLDRTFGTECLLPAKALTGLPRFRHMRGRRDATWIHFALDTHQVVRASGLLAESLYLGPMVINGLTPPERRTLETIFGPVPADGSAWNGPPSRAFLGAGMARRALSRGSGQRRPAATRNVVELA